MTVFDQENFPIINIFKFCHNKSWTGFVSSNRLAPDPDSAKFQDPDSVNMDPKHLLID